MGGAAVKHDFKFRHANEIAGTFVIAAVVLLVVGIVLAGRSQGWFEGRFALNIVFTTDEGSFGLQEGDMVQVRSTHAGRVGKIKPTESGQMGTTLIIKERFRRFITRASIAKVKKKFGVAGDAYVELVHRPGLMVEDGDVIACKKDKALIETAQSMLDELEKTVVPMVENVEKSVASVAAILARVESGEGVAGSLVSDTELRDDVTAVVRHLEAVSANAERAVAQVEVLLTNNVSSIVGDISAMTGETRTLLSRDVPRVSEGLIAIQEELQRTLRESRRLITAAQRHWLLRKYVKQESNTVPLIPSVLAELGAPDVSKRLREKLTAAQAAADSGTIAPTAYNLAVCRLAVGDTVAAEGLNTEARVACRAAGASPASTHLLEAELQRRRRDLEGAIVSIDKALETIDGERERETRTEAYLLLAAVHIDAGNLDAADEAVHRAERLNRRIERPAFSAAVAGLQARLALQRGDTEAAAAAFTAKAESLREADAWGSMVLALRQAGDAYRNLGKPARAAASYYRAASSLVARGDTPGAATLLTLAEVAAKAGADTLLAKRITQMKQDLE